METPATGITQPASDDSRDTLIPSVPAERASAWSAGRVVERLSGLFPGHVDNPAQKGSDPRRRVNSVRPGLEGPSQVHDPVLTEPHISCRLVSALLQHLESTAGRLATERVIEHCGLPRFYLEDNARWVSTTFIGLWIDAVCKELSGLDDLPERDHDHWAHYHEAGKQSLKSEHLGPVFWVLRTMGSAAIMYSQLPRQVQRANRSIQMHVSRQRLGHAAIEVHEVIPGAFHCAHCWNTRGILEAVPTIWGGPEATVEHTECMHDPVAPAERCVYRVSFRERPLKRVVQATVPALLATAGAALGAYLAPESAIVAASAGSALTLLLLGWNRAYKAQKKHVRDVQELERALEKSDKYVQHIWEEKHQHHRALLTSRKLSGYLSAELVEQVLEDPGAAPTLGGEKVDAAVLFADIVGFTSRSEKMDPERVVQELNHYFSYIDPVLEHHDGVLDKRMGDGIMVVFVPRSGETPEDVRRRALRCGLALLRTVDAQNPESAAQGIEPVQIRVGIAAGPTVRGNIGSDTQIEYTVIGDTVNLGARLESRAEPGRLMVTRNIFEAAEDVDLRTTQITRKESLQVRGRDQAQDTVELQPRMLDG